MKKTFLISLSLFLSVTSFAGPKEELEIKILKLDQRRISLANQNRLLFRSNHIGAISQMRARNGQKIALIKKEKQELETILAQMNQVNQLTQVIEKPCKGSGL